MISPDLPDLPDKDEWAARDSRFLPMTREEIDIHHARHEEMNRKHDEKGGKWTIKDGVKSRRIMDIEMTKEYAASLPGEYWYGNQVVAVERLIDGKWIWVGELDIQGNYEVYTREQIEQMYPQGRYPPA